VLRVLVTAKVSNLNAALDVVFVDDTCFNPYRVAS
jgi:hypothetical protein